MAAFKFSTSLLIWTGYSTDTKPTANIDRDSLAMEFDTGNSYIWTGTEWLPI
jgi:hypothetical protein